MRILPPLLLSSVASGISESIWQIVFGSDACMITADGRCITDVRASSFVDELCTVRAMVSLRVTTTFYLNKYPSDYLTIGGIQYRAPGLGPRDVHVPEGDVVRWRQGSGLLEYGFVLCGLPDKEGLRPPQIPHPRPPPPYPPGLAPPFTAHAMYSGHCPHPIVSLERCTEAAILLGLHRGAAAVDDGSYGNEYKPPWCYMRYSRLLFNTNGTNLGGCHRNRVCLCDGDDTPSQPPPLPPVPRSPLPEGTLFQIEAGFADCELRDEG